MSSDSLGSIYTIVSIIAGLVALGAYIEQAISKLRKRQEEIAIQKAEMLKKSTEDIAKGIKEANEKQILELRQKLSDFDEKLEKTYQRADLVNGNVSNIRTDIADLQEDILELYSSDDIEYEQDENGRHAQLDRGRGRDAVSARKNRKRTELNRRIKRRQIETDRVSQSERREEKAYRDSRDNKY